MWQIQYMMDTASKQISSDGSSVRQPKTYLGSMVRKLLWLHTVASVLPPSQDWKNVWRRLSKADRKKFGQENAAAMDNLKLKSLEIQRGSGQWPVDGFFRKGLHPLIDATIRGVIAAVKQVVATEALSSVLQLSTLNQETHILTLDNLASEEKLNNEQVCVCVCECDCTVHALA